MPKKMLHIAKHLAEHNEYDYNLLKAVEELAELSEVLLKKVNKKGGPKEPEDKEIIDEIGDVLIRTFVLSHLFGKEAVLKRILEKSFKIQGYIKEGKYKGKI